MVLPRAGGDRLDDREMQSAQGGLYMISQAAGWV